MSDETRLIGRTCPDCHGDGKQTGDGGGMDGGGAYHHPPCETCDDEGQVVPASALRGAVEALEAIVAHGETSATEDGWVYARELRDIASDALVRLRGRRSE